jgi:hypothetical protein
LVHFSWTFARLTFRLRSFTDEFKEAYPDIKQSWIQELLRKEGWIVPSAW